MNPASSTAAVLASTRRLIPQIGIVLALVLIALALGLSNGNFFTAYNLSNVLRQVSINGILAVGMTFVIVTGGIDLSVGSLLAFTGMVAASAVSGASALNPLAGAALAIAAGAALGACNGGLIAYLRLPAFVVTLGMLSAARGLTLIWNDGMPISNLPEAFKFLGQGQWLGVPAAAVIFITVTALAWIALRYTVYGRWIYAVGGNIRSARLSGIGTTGIVFSVYVLMGALSGMAGTILTARTTAALPQAGVGYELDAIAAVVIGGTSLAGGVGSVLFTLVGVLIIGVINNGLDLLGVSSYYQQVIKGVIIVGAVLIDRARRREGGWPA
ncbi:MAG TPA: ABC transporter permease [Steroidobacteraceae bacterium]|nr:ABC transporter permease [Steroidobacteraceae bacterium]